MLLLKILDDSQGFGNHRTIIKFQDRYCAKRVTTQKLWQALFSCQQVHWLQRNRETLFCEIDAHFTAVGRLREIVEFHKDSVRFTRLRIEQAKADAANVNNIIVNTAATTLRRVKQTRTIRHPNIKTTKPFSTTIGVRHEAQRRIIETQAWETSRVLFHRKLHDLTPPRRKCLWLWRLQ